MIQPLGRTVLAAFVVCLLALPASAQNRPVVPSDDSVGVRLGATVQGRFSAGYASLDGGDARSRVGFGLRRIRLRVDADLAERFGLHIQLEGAGTAPIITDTYGFYRLADGLRVRLGRMVVAQPRSLTLTSHAAIDAIDRAAIAEVWGAQTIDEGGRDFGIDLVYATNRTTLMAGLYNGDGSWSRARGNFREGISDGAPTGTVDQTGLAASVYGHHELRALGGLELGGHASFNAAENPNTAGRTYASYSAHAYWGAVPGSQPIRLKADVLGIVYEEVPAAATPGAVLDADGAQQTLGASLLGAVRMHPSTEIFGRIEQYTPNLNLDDREERYVTGGVSFSPSALMGERYRKVRITTAYSGLFPQADDLENRHLGMVQVQLVF